MSHVAQNRHRAWTLLKAKLYNLERERAEQERIEARRALLGVVQGSRSDRIRTYNFPQDRVTGELVTVCNPCPRPPSNFAAAFSSFYTDHRVNLRYNLSDVMGAGQSLSDLITNLRQYHNIEALMDQIAEDEAKQSKKGTKR